MKENHSLDFIGIPGPQDQLPLGLFLPEVLGLDRIGELVAAQHLKDRVSPYLEDETAMLAREEAWRNIATLIPSEAGNLVSLMRGLQLARAGELEVAIWERRDSFSDPLQDGAFEAIQDADSRTILTDILRAATHHQKYENVFDEEVEFYRDIGLAFYGSAFQMTWPTTQEEQRVLLSSFDGGRFEAVASISPGKVMQFALRGRINAPRNYTYKI